MKLAKQVQVDQLASRSDLRQGGVTKAMLRHLTAREINYIWCRAYGQRRFGQRDWSRDLTPFVDQILAGKITKRRPSLVKRAISAGRRASKQLLLF